MQKAFLKRGSTLALSVSPTSCGVTAARLFLVITALSIQRNAASQSAPLPEVTFEFNLIIKQLFV